MDLQEYKVMSKVENEHWWFIHRLKLVKTILRNEYKGKKNKLSIFDAGCGTGGMLLNLKEVDFIDEVKGCEPHPWACRYTQKLGISIENCKIEEVSNIDTKFDIALSMDVFYHKKIDPKIALNTLYDLLKPEGLLILNVAAMPCLKRGHDERDWGARRFLPEDLKILIRKSKFELISLNYWNTFLTPIIWVQSRCYYISKRFLRKSISNQSSLRLPNKLINNTLIRILEIENLLSKYFKYFFGSSLLLIARKK